MSGVAYHAWTHRPKNLGGTDPIEFGMMPWARIQKTYSSTLQTIAGTGGFNDVKCGVAGDGINMDAGESGNGVFEEYVAGGFLLGLRTLVNGVYLVKCELIFNEAHNFNWGLGVNDDSGASHYANGAQNASQSITGTYEAYHRYDSTQTFILNCYQTSGSNKNIDAAFMEAIRIGDWTGASYESLDPDQ